MNKTVYDSIVDSLGSRVPECGGVLGAGEDGIICEYYFDETGRSEPDVYIPDVEAINRVLEAWYERGIYMVGIVHSHREGLIAPSCGDVAYGMRILQALDTVEEFYLPILAKGDEGTRLYVYSVSDVSKSIACRTLDISLLE